MLETNLQYDVVPSFKTGRTVIGTSAIQAVTGLITDAKKGVQFKAASSNTFLVYVGISGVTAGTAVATDGIPLAAGEGIFIPVKDPSLVYAIAGAVAQDLHWMVV